MTTAPGRAALERVAAGAAVITAAIGGVALLGWAFEVGALKSVFPGLVTMKVNTALCFLLAGTALWLRRREPHPVRRRTVRLAQLAAGIVVLVGALTLSEYAFQWNLGIDELLFSDTAGAVLTSHPGRMAPYTALNFVLLGSALLSVDDVTRRGHRPAHYLAVAAGVVALLALTGYAYGSRSLYELSSFTAMALNTAMAFLVLCGGVLAVRPQRGLVGLLTSESAAGASARRLLPAAVAIPLLVGWVRLHGQRAGLYDTEFGTALFSVVTVLLLVALIRWDSTALFRTEEALRATQARLQQVLDSSTAVIYATRVVGETFVPSWVSENLTRMTGYDVQEALGRTWWLDHLHPDDRARVLAELPVLLATGQLTIECRFRYRDGTYHWVHDEARLLRDAAGEPLEVFGAWLDVTDRKRAEEALKSYATQLEAANAELDAFAYSVSHDLRAPLRSIDGFSQALLEDYADRVDAAGRDYLQRVRAAAQRMGVLIDDLLELSRVTRSEIHREPVDLSALARSVAAELARGTPTRQVDVAIAPGLFAEGDARLLRVVLENLLGNAWKYTAKNARARIEFAAAEHDGRPAYYVRDDGAGFDMAYAGKLFGAFQRPHRTAEFEGTGIGLATVQRIIHRHGGRVWAEGAVEQGATFYFTL